MNAELWRQVEAALDARLDPFAQPELRRALRADRDAELEVRRLLGRLALLERLDTADLRTVAPKPWSPKRTLRAAGWAAALVLSSALGLWFLQSRTTQRAPQEHPGPSALDTISLVISRESVPAPQVARVVLAPRSIVAWTLEGETP